MLIFEKISDFEDYLRTFHTENKQVGFVPTMGALHQGHISLVERAKKENDIVVVSIFINPTQFNNPNDLLNYPRTPESDYLMLEKSGTDAVLSPSVDEIYNSEEVKNRTLEIGRLGEVMEGVYRPGHFNGVIQVVSRLFEIVKPGRAYFGEKDFQQLAVIRYMVKAMRIDVEIVPCPTVREKNGLAMSSRNLKLSDNGKDEATAISKALSFARQNYNRFKPHEIKQRTVEMIESSGNLKVEYVEISDEVTLEPVSEWSASKHARCFAAVFCEGVRLIDNMPLY